MAFKPSKYQQAIFDWIRDGAGHAVIEAKAGSGKTSTAVAALKHIPAQDRALFLAFGKAIATELASRVPSNATASTLNSIGHRAWGAFAGRVRVDANKTSAVIEATLTELERRRWGSVIRKLVALAKAIGLAPMGVAGIRGLVKDELHVWFDLIDHHDVELGLDGMSREKQREVTEGCIALTRRVLARSVEDNRVIDFDDQIYLPVLYGIAPQRHNWVFIDEAQDLSPAQQKLAEMACRPDGRIVAIGDKNQAIYGWRGADNNGMENLRERLGAIVLPLSICYRCPKSHIALAQDIVPEIEAAPDADEGEVVDYGDEWDASVFTNEDIIICRAGAPLVRAAFRILSQKMAVRILGRDIGAGIISLIRKLNCYSQTQLSASIEAWRKRECEKILAKDPEANTDKVDDKADTVVAFMEMFPTHTPEMLCREVERLYSNDTAGILTLSTVHKSKGLEAKRVFILDSWMLESSKAKRAWQRQQNANLHYVALTRAKAFLGFIDIKRKGEST